MLMPKRTKHRKMMRGRMNGIAYRGSSIAFGDFALKAVDQFFGLHIPRLPLPGLEPGHMV